MSHSDLFQSCRSLLNNPSIVLRKRPCRRTIQQRCSKLARTGSKHNHVVSGFMVGIYIKSYIGDAEQVCILRLRCNGNSGHASAVHIVFMRYELISFASTQYIRLRREFLDDILSHSDETVIPARTADFHPMKKETLISNSQHITYALYRLQCEFMSLRKIRDLRI
jgi:hypothetical protein